MSPKRCEMISLLKLMMMNFFKLTFLGVKVFSPDDLRLVQTLIIINFIKIKVKVLNSVNLQIKRNRKFRYIQILSH